MIYIILPKAIEAPDWGFSVDEILIVKAIGGEARYGMAHFKRLSEGETSVISLPDSGIVCYFDNRVSVEIRPRYRELLHDLLPTKRRVFRHFGGEPLQNMSPATMKARMLYDSFWEEGHVMPFSKSGGSDETFRWLPLIRDVRQACFKNSTLSVHEAMPKLNDAWTLADSYFNYQIHMRTMLEVLFPLYLTLSGDESAEDQAAAIQAARQIIEGEAFGPVKAGIEANLPGLETGMRLSRNLTIPSPPDLTADFISWFKELSGAYTKILALDDEADPFGHAVQ